MDLARIAAVLGMPIPTKHVCPFCNVREAAIVIISSDDHRSELSRVM